MSDPKEPLTIEVNGKSYTLRPLVMGVLFELLDWLEETGLPLDDIQAWVKAGIRDKRFMEILVGQEIEDYEAWPVMDVIEMLLDFFVGNSPRLMAMVGKTKGVLSGLN